MLILFASDGPLQQASQEYQQPTMEELIQQVHHSSSPLKHAYSQGIDPSPSHVLKAYKSCEKNWMNLV
jgi:hypothetical protein